VAVEALGGETDTTEPPIVLPMDPRIRQRRVAVRRSAGRRRLRILLGGLGVFTLAGAALAVAHSPLLDVRHVRVSGAAHTDPDTIVHAAGLDRRHHMIDISAAAIAGRVRRLPWVGSVHVQVSWPSTVRLVVTERTPVVAEAATPAKAPNRWALADASGRVVDVIDGPAPNLVRLVGVPVPGRPGSQLDGAAAGPLTVLAALPSDLAGRVTTVGLASDSAAGANPEIDLDLSTGGRVRIGSLAALADKIVALRTVLARVDLHAVATIDVRVPTAPVLTRNA
jgi:cell division protein FtsQ